MEQNKGYEKELRRIPASRVRISDRIPQLFSDPNALEKKALSMNSTPFVDRIKVRPLTEEEKEEDPDHDFELFYGVLTLKGAQMLGWAELDAYVFQVSLEDSITLNHLEYRYTEPLTWIETYKGMEKILREKPDMPVERLAIQLREDPVLAKKVMRAVKLINEGAMDAICVSVQNCHEGSIDLGGYRFRMEFAVPLAKLENMDPDSLKIEALVERTVKIAIDNEMDMDDMLDLVDWVLEGNEPGDFYTEEA